VVLSMFRFKYFINFELKVLHKVKFKLGLIKNVNVVLEVRYVPLCEGA
jgi:hypothetical protein